MSKKPPPKKLAPAAAQAARQRASDAIRGTVSTAKATKPAKPATVAQASVAKPQVELGGTQHLFVNVPPGALFTWEPSANMPGVYVKWSPHFFRKLGEQQPGWIHPGIAGKQCFYLPENEVTSQLNGLYTAALTRKWS